MVDDGSEDVFMHLASETGYRFCSCSDNDVADDTRFFSAVWDPNSPSSYLQCAQDGYVYYLSGEKRQKFEIQFRRFTSDVTSQMEQGRRVPYHWDKVSLIPGRSGDILFLLGVSKTLLYTSLPGSSSIIANYSSELSTGFTNGTPVVEVLSHHTRITCLAVSSHGELVVSGDEQGYIKILYIRRQDKDRRHRAKYDFAEAEDAERGVKTHQGPIFAMQWIDTTLDNIKYLVTASSDRCVRIWRIRYGQPTGVAIEPVLGLDTVSADMLNLASLSCDTNFTHLAASTNLGSVYIWRLDLLRLHGILGSRSQEDDGSHIQAIIHSSSSPIVHVVLHPQDRLTVATGDVRGDIRIYTSSDSDSPTYQLRSQAHFPSPVIAMAYRQRQASKRLDNRILSVSYIDTNGSDAPDELAVFTLHGELHSYPIASVTSVEHIPQENGVSFTSPSSPSNNSQVSEAFEQKCSLISEESDDESPRLQPPTPTAAHDNAPKPQHPIPPVTDSFKSDVRPIPSPTQCAPTSPLITATPTTRPPPPPPASLETASQIATPTKKHVATRPVSPKKTSFSGIPPPPASHLPPPVSEYAAASLNSIKKLQNKVQEIRDDELSVHSIETTSTERHQLANAMVNHRRDLERYTDLPSLEALEQQHKPRKVAVKKQVDKNWLRRKAEFALTDEAMAVLTPPKPLVQLSLLHTPTPSKKSCPLKARRDAKGIHHEFTFEVYAEEVFGKMDPYKDVQSWNDEYDKLCQPWNSMYGT